MTTIQTINKLIAREKNVSEDLVESINSFYWKEVRKNLSNLEHSSVSIKYIGTITTSKRKIDSYIKTLIKKIRNIKASNRYKESTKALLLDVNYEKLKKSLVQRNILSKQYYETYMERAKRIRSISTNDIQECSSDIGSDNQSGEGTIQPTS